MNRILLIVIILVLISSSLVYASSTMDSDNLQSLIKQALENNPDIKAAQDKYKAAEYKITSAGWINDPQFQYGYFGKNVETRVGPQEHRCGISQKIPFPAKLYLRSRTQSKQAQMLKEKYEAVKREVIKDLKWAFYDLFWIDKSIQIANEEKLILESLEKTARARYESNKSPQQDVLKAQVELAKLEDKLFILNQNRNSILSRINSILNRGPRVKIQSIDNIDIQKFDYQLDSLIEMAKSNRQELLADKRAVEKAKYEHSLAKMDYLPDFTFGLDYIQVGSGHTNALNDGQDAWMAKFAVNVPIWFNKLRANVREKSSLLEANKNMYENKENNIEFEVQDAYYKVMTYNNIISLYKTALLPQTQQSFDAAKSGYETGKVDFLNWLDSERALLQTRLAYHKAVVDYKKSIAYLERAVGKDL